MRSIVLSVLLFAISASAQMAGNPENWCREGFFTRDTDKLTIAAVKGGRSVKSYFSNDDKDTCPGSADCQRAAFVVGGDELVVNRSFRAYSCAWFAPKTGRPTVGWIKTADLRFTNLFGDPSELTWLGEWKYGDNAIEITANKLAGNLNVTGTAMWKGIGDNVHVGEIDGRYEPKDGIINYSDGDDEYDCKVTIRLFGKYLVVTDNMKCGGVNVSFSGIYTHRNK